MPHDRPPSLARVLRTTRERLGLSHQTLSVRSGITRSYIVDLESGKKANPSYQYLERIARAMGLRIGELLRCL